MNIGPVDYASPTPPEGYRCTTCGRGGCKLWRESYTFAPVEPLCCDCTSKVAERDVSEIDADGRTPWRGLRTDTIGSWVPAVPDGDGSWWGFTSVPSDGVAWWKRLPTRPFTGELPS